jgi:hypothetical protein
MGTFDLQSGMSVLERTPRVMRTLLAGLGPEWTDTNEGPDTWSPYVVMGHLIHGERADWIPRAEIILAQGDNRTFAPFDRNAQFEESKDKVLAQLLVEFEHLRKVNLKTLAGYNLTDVMLDLTGEHPAFGRVTLRQLLATWVAHDLGHIAQCVRVMARQYRDAIGPWREYLTIMDR